VLTLAEKPVPQTSEFIATIRSLRSITVQPQVEGIVRRILVRAGESVTAGQPMAQIDPDKQQATLSATESQRAAREADVAFTSQQLARLRKLFDVGAVSQAELEQAESAHKTAEAQLAALASQIREAEVQLAYYRVTAPAAGIVGDISIREGDRVTPSTAITSIDQNAGLEVYINVPLERATGLRLGLPVEIVDTNGTVTATNPITFIASRADDTTQSVLVKAALRPSASLRIMQYVRARVVWSTEPRMTVPVVAVNRLGGQYFVFVAEQGQQGFVARQTPISVGDVVGNEYIVQSGVKPGDRVIVSNLQKIGDGAPVKPTA
jgi:RND family efflux transporter MFP subunit